MKVKGFYKRWDDWEKLDWGRYTKGQYLKRKAKKQSKRNKQHIKRKTKGCGNVVITFDDTTIEQVIETLGYKFIWQAKYLADKNGEVVLDVVHKQMISKGELGGITKEGVFKNDIESIMEMSRHVVPYGGYF